MKRSWIWVALLLSIGVNIGILAMIGTSRYRIGPKVEEFRPDGPPPFARLADHLDLEGQARERFLAIQEELFTTTRRHREDLESLRRALRAEVVSDQPDPERVEELLRQSGEVGRRLDRAMVESVLATREILTPDQQRRYLRLLERLQPGGRRFGPRGHPPSGRRPRSERSEASGNR